MKTTESDNLNSLTGQPPFAEGQKLAGCYVLRKRVEMPALGQTWLAFDEVLGKDVSLHFIPDAVRSDARAMDTLRQEIKRNRQLIHPQILRIYDFIEEGDWAAVSMDGFDGESLAASLASRGGGFFEPSQIAPWISSLCQTLDDAHKTRLVHRDLSPENVIVEKSGRVLVTEFGMSRLIRDALGRSSGAANADPALAYMSPQQLDGEKPTPADDIYGLGALLHELLTGAPPLTGSDLVAQIRRKVPVSIAERRMELKKVGAAVPAAWEKVIAACLEKSSEQRPKSMAEIAARLDSEKAGATLSVVPVAAHIAPVAPTKTAPAQGSEPKHEIRALERPVNPAKRVAKPAPAEPVASVAALMPEVKVATQKKPKPPLAETPIADDYPSFGPRRSSFPITGLAAAVILIAIGIYGFFFYDSGRPNREFAESDPNSEQLESSETNVVSTEVAEAANPPSVPDESTFAEAGPTGELPSPTLIATANLSGLQPVPEEVAVEKVAAAPAAPPRRGKNATPEPAKPASTPSPAGADETSVVAKTAALEKAMKEVEAAEREQQALLKQKEQAEAGVLEAQKAMDEKLRVAAPMLKATEELSVTRKAREEEMRAAELAAQQAQQAATEKTRLADEAKKALATLEKEGKEKLSAQQKIEAELKASHAAIGAKQKAALDATKGAADAAARRAELLAAVKRGEQELTEARVMAQKAADEAMVENRKKVESEIAEARRIFEKRMKELEDSLNKPAGGVSTPAAVPEIAPQKTTPAPVKTSPPPTAKVTTPAPTATPAPPLAVNSAPAAAETTLAMNVPSAKPLTSPLPEVPTTQKAQAGRENSLQMKFAPVGDVLFSVWQTRVQDFETFAKSTNLKSTLWKDPGFRQGPDHPVVNVTWREAVAFCKWLTVQEQRNGLIAATQEYRLPTDLEWSKAAGLPDESGKTPEARDMGVPDIYPWGSAWPPPARAGNYTGEETGSDVAIKGYDDGFAWTAPVGSFQPNQYGLFDMGGNVWQWCMDSWNAEQKAKVLRGASWYNGALKLSLLSSCRVHAAPDSSTDNYGFRCVLAAAESGKPPRK